MVEEEIEFPPGVYYVGDPCYVLSDDIYDTWWGEKTGYASGVIETPKGTFLVANTEYGDGTYRDEDGTRYPVDSGTLALVPWDMCDTMETHQDVSGDGRVVTFQHRGCFRCEDGIFEIGDGETDITIDTSM